MKGVSFLGNFEAEVKASFVKISVLFFSFHGDWDSYSETADPVLPFEYAAKFIGINVTGGEERYADNCIYCGIWCVFCGDYGERDF